MQPWLLPCPHAQTLVSTLNHDAKTGFSITLNTENSLDVSVGTGSDIKLIQTDLKPKKKTWAKVKLVLNKDFLQLDLTSISFKVEPVPSFTTFESRSVGDSLAFGQGSLFIAASQSSSFKDGQTPTATDFFNGRIDRLTIKSCSQTPLVLLKYDFALEMSSDRIIDVSGHGHNGTLVNAPTRAVKGHDWDGLECDWTKVTYGYGAIHFHDDDMDDAKWDTDFVITIPPTARSGAYAVKVETTNGEDSDYITFFVRPNQWKEYNSGKVCLIFSTFTYLAYANERLYDTERDNTADLGPGFDINNVLKSEEFHKMQRRLDLGLSCYDRHTDGSGGVLFLFEATYHERSPWVYHVGIFSS